MPSNPKGYRCKSIDEMYASRGAHKPHGIPKEVQLAILEEGSDRSVRLIDLSAKWGVSVSHISRILNGACNRELYNAWHKLKEIEAALEGAEDKTDE